MGEREATVRDMEEQVRNYEALPLALSLTHPVPLPWLSPSGPALRGRDGQ